MMKRIELKFIYNVVALFSLMGCGQTIKNNVTESISNKESDSLYNICNQKIMRGDTVGVTINLNKLYAFDSTDVLLLCKLALLKQNMHQINSATILLNKAQNIGKYPSEVYYTKGLVYHSVQSLDTAIFYYQMAIKLCPDSFKYIMERANTYYEKKTYDYALLDINKAIEIDTNNPAPHVTQAFIHYNVEKWDLANASSNKAIQLIKKKDAILNDSIDEKNHVKTLIGTSINAYYFKLDMLYYISAFANYRLSNLTKASADAEMAIKLNPNDGKFYKIRGFIKNKLGDKESSFEDFKIAAELGDAEAIEIHKQRLEYLKTHKKI